MLDTVTSLLPYGNWNPLVDGIFNAEGYFSGETTAKTTPKLAVVDNIDTPIPEPARRRRLRMSEKAWIGAGCSGTPSRTIAPSRRRFLA